MKHILPLILWLCCTVANAAGTGSNESGAPAGSTAADYRNMEPPKLQPVGMAPELNAGAAAERPRLTLSVPEAGRGMDLSFFKQRTNPGLKPYRVMDDLSFVGIPLFLAGWAIKSEKAMFRTNYKDPQGNQRHNTQLLTNFKTGIDDYSQFFGPVMVAGLKLGGVEGRSDWPRLMASAAMSYGIMAGLVNTIKYTAKEMRPDGSTANSWPSGHTATAFVGATMLHKEYGLTRSPWYSVAGYAVATATGVMRVLNNRHWVSDVMSGAGIGIMSTELGYALSDVLFKGRGLLRNDLESHSQNPSFFSINMGVGLGNKSLDIGPRDMMGYEKFRDAGLVDETNTKGERIEFRSATVVDAEGAYFFNRYIGVGGRFRVRAMSAKSFGKYADIAIEEPSVLALGMIGGPYIEYGQLDNLLVGTGNPVSQMYGVVESDHITEFTGSAGIYLNLPLTSRLSIGTKLLLGRSITQDLDIDAYAEGDVTDIKYSMSIQNGVITRDANGNIAGSIEPFAPTGATYATRWDYLTISAKNSTSYGTGISLTYQYKSNFSWRLFCDYDYTKKEYTLTADDSHFLKEALTPSAYALVSNPSVYQNSVMGIDGYDPSLLLQKQEYRKKKKMQYWTIGLSFMVGL